MTSSASVVESEAQLKRIVKDLITHRRAGDYDLMADDVANCLWPLLNATPPAEQDAREAVAKPVGIIAHVSRGRSELPDLVHAALTQAAPDGWREVFAELLRHSVWHYGNPKDETCGVGLTHARARAMLSASPAPPAQGAGG